MVISVTFLDLTGDDYSDACRKAGEELSCPVLYVPAAGYDGDLFAGYASALVGLVGSLDWSLPITHPKRVAVLGYLFDRYEGDHQGNLMQLKGLLKGIGLELGPVLLSGKPYADLADTPMCGMLIQFPYVARRAKRLKRLSKRDLVAVDMPIGFRGTSNFLRVVGEDAGVDPKRIEAYITKKTAAVMSSVNILADRLRGLRVAIFADLPLCAGLISLLDEFGITTVLVGIRGTSLGGAPALHETLGRYGCDTAENLEIIEHPSIRQAAHSVWELYQAREIDGVLCSSTELCGISRVFTDHADEVDIRSGQSLFYVEIGFPSHRHHVIVPQPFMGFGGVVVMAQRIYDAHRILDAGPVGDR